MIFDVELTDTVGGEANYSWVNRHQITMEDGSSDLAVVREAKKALGLTGCRCKRNDYGDMVELRPCGSLTVAFITPSYS